MESTALQSIVCTEVSWLSGLPQSHLCLSLFGRTSVVFLRHRPPRSIKKAGSSSRELRSPSECFQSSSARCVTASSAFHGVFSLLATSAPGVHISTGSQPAFVPPAAFLALSTAYSSMRLEGLFHPTATSRVSLQGVPPANQPAHLVDAPYPLAVGAELLPMVAHLLQLPTRRPQGLAPVRDPQPPRRG